ncbi:MAG: aconitate hydratase AcnA [Deltaproteobacteria bacterium]|nr:aconitate hydratase AcnA [Deltaproteobacteria bacterium]
MTSQDSFHSRVTIHAGGRQVEIHRLDALIRAGFEGIATLPYSIRVLLENLLRYEDGTTVTREDIEAVANWDSGAAPSTEIAFRPSRVLLQDFTGVPAIVDLAAMRDQFAEMGGDPSRINPLQPADLVIDHSVQVDSYGLLRSFEDNVRREFERNQERYQFLKWGQTAFENMSVVPPGTGIVHQVNLEYLARVVFTRDANGKTSAYPDSLVGTDSHTTMINGLGVLGWGVGGIEAEAAMLGQPISMLLPQVVGFELTGKLREGATATDAVLTVTQMLREKGVVGKFVEFYGKGMESFSLPDRATIANMAPEYGATMGFFPVDNETLAYLRFTGRDEVHVDTVERVLKEQGLFHTASAPNPRFTDTLKLDLSDVVPSIAGPKRPQDRIPLSESKRAWHNVLEGFGATADKAVEVTRGDETFPVQNGAVVIAAITSCTNTSNPSVMLAAGLVAKKAVEKGLRTKPWVKTSLAPGSQVVTEYLKAAGLMSDLELLRFNLVGYGCTTCIGNSGPLDPEIGEAIQTHDLIVTSALSGNRNFEGRVNPLTRANYLASPPLVVAYALTGTMDIDFETDPIGQDADGKDVFLSDIWPSHEEITDVLRSSVKKDQFLERYAVVLDGPPEWQDITFEQADQYRWDPKSTYIRLPPFFEGVEADDPAPPTDIEGARVLCLLGDSVTTDHISPAGAIALDSPAARYLQDNGVSPRDFNSYGSRRGNHEVMMRGTFANIRLRNLLAPGTEGGVTRYLPNNEQMSIYDAAMRYQADGTPLVVIAGKEYGTGSSRDWAAKGTLLLGARAVIAESYERIHRSNLIGMGVLPLEFQGGDGRESLGLTGEEAFTISGVSEGLSLGKTLSITTDSGKSFRVKARLDTPQEVEYYLHGGILQYVLRQLAAREKASA